MSSPRSCKADGVLARALFKNTECAEVKESAVHVKEREHSAATWALRLTAYSPQYFKCTVSTVHLRANFWWKSKHESRSCRSFFGPFLGAFSLTLSWQLEPKVNFILICLLANNICEVIPCSPGNSSWHKDTDHNRLWRGERASWGRKWCSWI